MPTLAFTMDKEVKIPEHLMEELHREMEVFLQNIFGSLSPRRRAIAQEILGVITLAEAVEQLGAFPESLVRDTMASMLETLAKAFYDDPDFIQAGLIALTASEGINAMRKRFNTELKVEAGVASDTTSEIIRKAAAL